MALLNLPDIVTKLRDGYLSRLHVIIAMMLIEARGRARRGAKGKEGLDDLEKVRHIRSCLARLTGAPIKNVREGRADRGKMMVCHE